jgi:hypothetical protein
LHSVFQLNGTGEIGHYSYKSDYPENKIGALFEDEFSQAFQIHERTKIRSINKKWLPLGSHFNNNNNQTIIQQPHQS